MHRFERINMHGVFRKPRHVHVLYSLWKEIICLLGFILHYLEGKCNVICHLTYFDHTTPERFENGVEKMKSHTAPERVCLKTSLLP